jgi:hypothetical protein
VGTGRGGGREGSAQPSQDAGPESHRCGWQVGSKRYLDVIFTKPVGPFVRVPL